LGMLQALGLRAFDKNGKELGPYGRDILDIYNVDLENMDSRLAQATIQIANDVDNPLCGERGATYVYGPQKGMTEQQLLQYDNALNYFGTMMEKAQQKTFKQIPGAGAAGGLGFAFLMIGAELTSGASVVAEAIKLEKTMKRADIVITGEGQTDEQTIEYGKTAAFVGKLAQKYQVPALLISGSVEGDMDRVRKRFAGCFSTVTSVLTLEECMKQADILLYEQTKNVFHFIESLVKHKRMFQNREA